MTSKRLNKLKKKASEKEVYTPKEAIELVKELATAKFDETIEVAFNLGIDPKQGDQQVRGTVTLPHGTGKTKRIAAFVEPANEKVAKKAGADVIGTQEVIDKIAKTGKFDFDVAIAEPSAMPKLAKAARYLGPQGMMPSPKTETVGENVEKMIKDQKAGKTAFRNDETGNLHLPIGKASFDEEKLLENLETVIQTLKAARPASAKGAFIRMGAVSSSMGPSIELDIKTEERD